MSKKYKLVVYIGRFQPFHNGHLSVLKKAWSLGDEVLVLIGSAFSARTVKNPFTAQERATMMLSTGEPKIPCVEYLHDYFYNEQAWVTQVQKIVINYMESCNCTSMSEVALIGHTKDESSYYLKMFPQWNYIEAENFEGLNSSAIRELMYNAGVTKWFCEKIAAQVPQSTIDVIRDDFPADERFRLDQENIQLKAYKEAWEAAPYPPTFVTADAVVVQSGHVLLIQRGASPGEGLWALPGGFVNQGETVEAAAIRELREETKLKVPEPVLRGSIKKSAVFDFPERSLRGRTITHAFLIVLQPGELPKVKGSDDAKKAKWVSINDFLKMEDQLFEDHFSIVTEMVGIA